MRQQQNHTWWTRVDGSGVVERAEFDGGGLAFDIWIDSKRYEVALAPSPEGPSTWRGAWTRPGEPGTGSAAGRLYRTADGSFALVGEWHEDGAAYRWVVEFQATR